MTSNDEQRYKKSLTKIIENDMSTYVANPLSADDLALFGARSSAGTFWSSHDVRERNVNG